MTIRSKNLITLNQSLLVNTDKTIKITNKLLHESNEEWWNRLDDGAKIILNTHIGKPYKYDKIFYLHEIGWMYGFKELYDKGTIETPNKSEFEKIFNIEKLYVLDFKVYDFNLFFSKFKNINEIIIDYNTFHEIDFLRCSCFKKTESVSLTNERIIIKNDEVVDNQIYPKTPIDSCNYFNMMKNLKSLHLYNFKIKNLRFIKDLRNLKDLSIVYNNIKDLSGIEELTELISLSLIENKLVDIKAIANMKNIKYLNLTDNEIHNIEPLVSLTNLEDITLDYNPISNLKVLGKLKKLKSIKVRNFNDFKLNKNDIYFLKQKLPECKIIF